MILFLILLPFGVFAALMLTATPVVALFSAAAVTAAIISYDVARGAAVKMLPAGTAMLFTALGCYLVLVDDHWSGNAIRATVDAGILAIALGSIAIRLPFTLQYAREGVEPEIRDTPGFITANYIVTLAWTAAFVLMLVADLLSIYVPGLPLWVGVGIAFAARNCAVFFTRWYSQYRRNRFAAQQAAMN